MVVICDSMSSPHRESRTPEFYPPIEPYRSGRLVVDEIHTLYWEECGNPAGVPVVFLHGGPGAGCSPEQPATSLARRHKTNRRTG